MKMELTKRELFILFAGLVVGAFGFYLFVRPELEQARQMQAGLQALKEAFTTERVRSPEEIEADKKLDAAEAKANAAWERIEEAQKKARERIEEAQKKARQ